MATHTRFFFWGVIAIIGSLLLIPAVTREAFDTLHYVMTYQAPWVIEVQTWANLLSGVLFLVLGFIMWRVKNKTGLDTSLTWREILFAIIFIRLFLIQALDFQRNAWGAIIYVLLVFVLIFVAYSLIRERLTDDSAYNADGSPDEDERARQLRKRLFIDRKAAAKERRQRIPYHTTPVE